ncbi:MAG: tRNA lysidine(34) synthetase TilS [Clostridia bacterium]|nr:tRNA lysidine(34) synthetase TilS [Clostridia bacterium]MDY4082781.1 tRNA lysidine(34) synthetase TilS [Eubacteriales bacterium]
MIDPTIVKKLQKFDCLALAVSGGKDSTFLLNYWVENRAILPDFFVVNVDHNLRGEESKSDSDFVRKLCKELGVECKCYDEDIKGYCNRGGYGLEQGARLRRREIFAEVVKTTRAERVVTAHHKDDQCESVLMHVFRGSGINGLKGMPFDDGLILRPLLNISSDEIEREMKRRGWEYRVDSSNLSTDYTRNKLRSEIIPMIKQVYPSVVDNVLRLASIAEDTQSFIDKFLVRAEWNGEELTLPDALAKCDEAVATASILEALDVAGWRVDIEKKHLQAIRDLFDKKPPARVDLPSGLVAWRERNGVVIAKEHRQKDQRYEVDYGSYVMGDWIVTLSKEYSEGALRADMDELKKGVLRYRQKGDKICKFGGGTKSLGDYLTDKKVPLRQRDGLAVIAYGSDVLAVIGVDISSKVAVREDTKEICYLSASKNTGEK